MEDIELTKEDLIEYFKRCLLLSDGESLIEEESGFAIINFYKNSPEIKIYLEYHKVGNGISYQGAIEQYFIATKHNKTPLTTEEYDELKRIWEEKYHNIEALAQKEEVKYILKLLK